MSGIDIIVLIIIVIHSSYRASHPKQGDENKSGGGIFIKTFLIDILIYLLISFIIGLIIGTAVPIALISSILGR